MKRRARFVIELLVPPQSDPFVDELEPFLQDHPFTWATAPLHCPIPPA